MRTKKPKKNPISRGVSEEQVCECVPLTLFIFHQQIFPNMSKYLQIFPDVCKYFSPPDIFHHDPCDIQPPSTLLFTKIIFVLLLRRRSGCWTLMLTSLPFEWSSNQPARQQLLTIKIFPESLTVRPLIEFFF